MFTKSSSCFTRIIRQKRVLSTGAADFQLERALHPGIALRQNANPLQCAKDRGGENGGLEADGHDRSRAYACCTSSR